MEFTQDQEKALENLTKWIKDPNEMFHTLDGAAGTGKTTITKAFINSLSINKRNIGVTAPTHKAKKEIQNATNFTGQTIQKLLGLRPDVNMDNFDPNKPVFNPLAEDTLMYYKVILIDESSMLNKHAYELIRSKASKYNVKVLFLGDAYQLPPVNEIMSKVFTDVKYKSTLEEVVRQKNSNPMSEMLKVVRQDVKNNTEFGIRKMLELQEQTYNDMGFKCLNNTDSPLFGDTLMEYYYSTEYEHNKDHIKFLSYTNKSVEAWSSAIRNKLLKEDSNNLVNVGEILTGYNSITNSKGDLLIENSEDYVVRGMCKNTSEYNIKGYSVTMETEEGLIRNVFVVDTSDSVNVDNFKTVYLEKLGIASARRGSYWKQYYTFKNSHLLLDAIQLGGRKFIKKDLYYGYGFTVHKSQGSTYDNVGINLKNIYSNYTIAERNRLLYVALSRARNMNLILKN